MSLNAGRRTRPTEFTDEPKAPPMPLALLNFTLQADGCYGSSVVSVPLSPVAHAVREMTLRRHVERGQP